MQIASTGTVSRVSLMTDKASNFLPSAAQIAPDSMLTRLDRLCESLGGTLRAVVIALFPDGRRDLGALQANQGETTRGLRAQMPGMARRQPACLLFRMSRKSWGEYYNNGVDETVAQHVFKRDSPYWMNIAL